MKFSKLYFIAASIVDQRGAQLPQDSTFIFNISGISGGHDGDGGRGATGGDGGDGGSGKWNNRCGPTLHPYPCCEYNAGAGGHNGIEGQGGIGGPGGNGSAGLVFIGLHPNLAIAAAFIVSAGEALPVVGLFSPSTVVLIGIGGFVGLGNLTFWPVFIATILGAAIGDSISYWTGRIYKERLVEIWRFSRYHGLLTAGQRHFAHRGGVSIVVGRFIPGVKPVVSGVAGIMGMGAVRFTLLNLLSATAWAAVHILPGFSAGLTLRGLNVISDGLAVVVGILAIGIVLAMWLAKGAIGSWLRHPPALQSARPIKNNR